MRFSLFTIFIAFFTCLFLTVPNVQAANIKERMASRIPAINALKDKGVVGENNQGFLEFRKPDNGSKKLVADENNDRKAVYGAIGKKQGAPAALVGQRRALQIAQIGKKGHWFQKGDGKWYKK